MHPQTLMVLFYILVGVVILQRLQRGLFLGRFALSLFAKILDLIIVVTHAIY